MRSARSSERWIITTGPASLREAGDSRGEAITFNIGLFTMRRRKAQALNITLARSLSWSRQEIARLRRDAGQHRSGL